MNSKTLIAHVNMSVAENWSGSDIWKQGEEMLEKISKHFENCKDCRDAFDAMQYKEGSLIDFEGEHLGNTRIEDWICGAKND